MGISNLLFGLTGMAIGLNLNIELSGPEGQHATFGDLERFAARAEAGGSTDDDALHIEMNENDEIAFLLALLRAGVGDSGGHVYSVLIAGRRVPPEGSVGLNTFDVGGEYAHVDQFLVGFAAPQDISPAAGFVGVIV
jgi:hypothetical protein